MLTVLGLGMIGLAGHPVAGEGNLSDFSRVMRRWGVDEGLTGSRVEKVVQTPDGHLWVGTEYGLFRFNGRRFERTDTEAVPELGHRWVRQMCLDIDGSLWLCTVNGRVATMVDGKFHAVPLPEETPTLIHWSPHPAGGVLAAIQGPPGTSIVHLTRSGVEALSAPLQGSVRSLQADGDGNLWLARAGAPIAELRDGMPVTDDAGAAPDTGVFLKRRDGNLWALGRIGIFERSGGEWRERYRFDPPLGKPPDFAVEAPDRRIWFGGQQADRMVWEEGAPPTRLRSNRASLPDVIQSALVDADGNLWFATFSGLFQARYVPFITWTPPLELPTERVVAVHPRPDGTVLFNCFGGICRLSPGGARSDLETLRPAAELTVCDAGEAGSIWLGNRAGEMARIQRGVVTRIPVGGGGRPLPPTALVVDHDGVAWFTSLTDVYRCDPRKEPLAYQRVSGANGLPENECHNIRLLADGSLLIAARRHGVFRRARGGEAWTLSTPPGDPDAQVIRAMDRDTEGRIWGFAERTGVLGCWSEQSAAKAPLAALGLAEEEIRGIALDDIGNLWFVTPSNGVGMARCDELLAAMEHRSGPPVIEWFDTSDGLGSKGGTFGSEGIRKGPDGRVWIATDGGLSVIDPAQWRAERDRASPLVVHIEECMVNGNPIEIDPPVRIPAGTARVGIRFAVLNFGFPREVRYRHRLRGTSDNWVDDGENDEVFFQQLRPGDYEFEVIAANRFEVWSGEPARLRLKVLPHWWQRTEVRVAGAAALALIVGLFVRARLRSLRARMVMRAEFSRQLLLSQEEERRRISRELHDSLGQNLLIAKNQLHLATAGAVDRKMEERLEKVAASVGAALEEARAISHQLRPFHLERLGLSKAMRAMIRETTESTRIPIEAAIEEVDGLLPGDSETMVYRLLQEAISNIVKHADASEVRVRLERRNKRLHLVIEDDGRGFDPKMVLGEDRVAPGLGLASFSERIELLGGHFHCRSQPGQGTLLTFDIPVPRSPSDETPS